MNGKLLYTIALLIFFVLLRQSVEPKKVTIHIPYRVKNVKHTHTVYKVLKHHHKSDDTEEDEHYDYY